MQGELKIIVKSAILKEDLDIFTKMDPYAIFTLGSQKFSTQVASSQGMYPEWGDEFTFFVDHDDKLGVILYDQDLLVDDFIGSAFMTIGHMADKRHVVKQLALHKAGRDAGTIKFEMWFKAIDTPMKE